MKNETSNTPTVTVEVIRALMKGIESDEARYNQLLVWWLDDDTIDAVPEPLLSDISWSDRNRPRIILANAVDLFSYSCPEPTLTDEDYEALAEMINNDIRRGDYNDEREQVLEEAEQCES